MTPDVRPGDSAEARQDRQTAVNLLMDELAEATDPNRRRRIIDAVARRHRGVVKAVARRFARRGIEIDDLEQVAWMGLIKAADRWRPGRCDDFLQYAVPTMTGDIRRYFRDHSATIRPPRRLQEIRSAASALEADDPRVHSDDVVAERIGVTVEDLRSARKISGISYPASLDVPLSDGDGNELPFSTVLPSTEPGFEQVENQVMLSGFLEGLAQRDLSVLRMRFVDEMSQSEIGAAIGVSQMQVSRILARLLTAARDHFGRTVNSSGDVAAAA
ncbi:sigma-70 family RNA polymerase sigma factor [Nakamurella sp. YIM 132087]|uniref:Sigma-70 family RNA polymerase sigma factor n=1 Tax=Nakamurella alba TaxID=2665158 RepID=A0A7K1FKK0_9ACTN|nr:sigma-70 family RNA polymerase sigma factor [Nakamurella alba]MTD14616.1 sigma-70 family RNA polymerase sigma factor [Nakamurella alba]